MLIDYRNNDAVITICQNNKAKSITISEINEAVGDIAGFEASDLVGKPLSAILPARIAELLTEYVEFEDDSNDVGAVISKVQSFSIVSRNGQEKAYKTKISRLPSSGGTMFFSLVLQDALGNRKNEAVRKVIRDNFKGHESLDMQTDLPDKASLVKDIDLMKRHGNSNAILSCFAILQIDDYDKFLAQKGISLGNELMKHVASIAARTMRPDDVVGCVGDGRLGVLLVDITRGSERLVLNRLRWQIASNPYSAAHSEPIELSVSISFYGISEYSSDRQVIEQCEAALDKLGAKSHNILVDATV